MSAPIASTSRPRLLGAAALAGAMLLALVPAAPAYAANTITVNSAALAGDKVAINITYTCDAGGPELVWGGAVKNKANYASAAAKPTCDGKSYSADIPATIKGSVVAGDQVTVIAELYTRLPDKTKQSYAKDSKQLTLQ